ncbi:MAG: septal ring lytic transglycosylase RlpA family protein, partial [Bacteroidota bacterium]
MSPAFRHHALRATLVLPLLLALVGCDPAAFFETETPPETAIGPTQGTASWYGYKYAGLPTANGETFDPEGLTAAHRTLPFGTRLRVTRLDTGAEVI